MMIEGMVAQLAERLGAETVFAHRLQHAAERRVHDAQQREDQAKEAFRLQSQQQGAEWQRRSEQQATQQATASRTVKVLAPQLAAHARARAVEANHPAKPSAGVPGLPAQLTKAILHTCVCPLIGRSPRI